MPPLTQLAFHLHPSLFFTCSIGKEADVTDALTVSQIKIAMQRVEKLIIRLEAYDEKGELTASLLHRFQEELDKIADIYQYDARVGKEKSYLYELQALILLAKGDEQNAEVAMETATKASGDPPSFISDTARKWYKNRIAHPLIENGVPEQIEKKPRFTGKIEGWLALYSLTFVAAPILLIVDLLSTTTN
jgi:hypothetical protein